jgi:hypothetical protein
MLPLWQRGVEGDFKDICLFIIHKISPCPSFPKRGIMGLDQKAIYKQPLLMRDCSFYVFLLQKFKEVI